MKVCVLSLTFLFLWAYFFLNDRGWTMTVCPSVEVTVFFVLWSKVEETFVQSFTFVCRLDTEVFITVHKSELAG